MVMANAALQYLCRQASKRPSGRRQASTHRQAATGRPARVATVAMANKTARTIWAIMARGETYRTDHQSALAA